MKTKKEVKKENSIEERLQEILFRNYAEKNKGLLKELISFVRKIKEATLKQRTP